MGRTWDDVSIDDASIEDIDRESIEYFLRKGIEAQRIPESLVSASTEEILTSLQLIDKKGKLKNAAILLFGKNPLNFFHSVEFKIGRFGQDESGGQRRNSVAGLSKIDRQTVGFLIRIS